MPCNTVLQGGGDTPLHLAAKWGHLEVVRLVMSYTQTSTDMTNKFGEVAAAVVCSRARERDADTETEIREILAGEAPAAAVSAEYDANARVQARW